MKACGQNEIDISGRFEIEIKSNAIWFDAVKKPRPDATSLIELNGANENSIRALPSSIPQNKWKFWGCKKKKKKHANARSINIYASRFVVVPPSVFSYVAVNVYGNSNERKLRWKLRCVVYFPFFFPFAELFESDNSSALAVMNWKVSSQTEIPSRFVFNVFSSW